MSKQRNKSIVDVHIILRSRGRVLLQLRENTGYADGLYHLPAGHLEEGEDFLSATARETAEELGIVIDAAAIDLAFTLHLCSSGSRIGLFFETQKWIGTPGIKEPDRCGGLNWFPGEQLPENTVPYTRYVLAQIDLGRRFGTFGWREREVEVAA